MEGGCWAFTPLAFQEGSGYALRAFGILPGGAVATDGRGAPTTQCLRNTLTCSLERVCSSRVLSYDRTGHHRVAQVLPLSDRCLRSRWPLCTLSRMSALFDVRGVRPVCSCWPCLTLRHWQNWWPPRSKAAAVSCRRCCPVVGRGCENKE